MSDVAIIGAGYVGVPLAQVFAEAGVSSVLIDVDADRVAALNRGESYIEDVPAEELRPLVEAGTIAATTNYDAVKDADAILVALPTPLSINREPDLSIVLGAVEEIAKRLRPGPPRGARVDYVPGNDPRRGAAAPRGRPASRSAPISTSPFPRNGSIRVAPTGRRRRPRRSSAASRTSAGPPPARSTSGRWTR